MAKLTTEEKAQRYDAARRQSKARESMAADGLRIYARIVSRHSEKGLRNIIWAAMNKGKNIYG